MKEQNKPFYKKCKCKYPAMIPQYIESIDKWLIECADPTCPHFISAKEKQEVIDLWNSNYEKPE